MIFLLTFYKLILCTCCAKYSTVRYTANLPSESQRSFIYLFIFCYHRLAPFLLGTSNNFLMAVILLCNVIYVTFKCYSTVVGSHLDIHKEHKN